MNARTTRHLPVSIEALCLPVATTNALRAGGISTLEKLRSKRPDDLMKLRGIGKHSVALIREVLTFYGLDLRVGEEAAEEALS
ncbi:DNA-directed RNA polymerase subunit alpha C-terminal domain-containing protein [Paraburkholderia sp. 35.1]|uniref:DNA-directed RNA polymerase subunit alpha C-terminal domain-containing protein n=1 Tax=Paraburkholderia sp. 35.1 TaxID=2991058 RepID=UPI003D192E22